jgi:hypothetical protein
MLINTNCIHVTQLFTVLARSPHPQYLKQSPILAAEARRTSFNAQGKNCTRKLIGLHKHISILPNLLGYYVKKGKIGECCSMKGIE